MNFSLLPPEVTSAQMYSGAGAGPMRAAAASWAGLGNELGAAAQSFSSVTGGLPWQGAAARAMTAVSSQYSQWLSAAATHAVGAATNANATAGIFEAAKAAITHPMAIMANRQQLVQLVRSNLFGFAAPAIAACEGTYDAMWAKNIGTLAGYHGAASSVAAQLTPWAQALQALPGASAPSNGLSAIMANAKANASAAQVANQSDLSRAKVASQARLADAGRQLTGGGVVREATASTLPTMANLRAAGRDVASAALLNTGTQLRAATRNIGVGALSAAQAGDILGGAGPLSSVRQEELAQALTAQPLLGGAGTGDPSTFLRRLTPLQQFANYSADQSQSLNDLSRYQMSTTQQLTSNYLADAQAQLFGGGAVPEASGFPSFANISAAAGDYAKAGLLNVGTMAQVGLGKALLAPMLLGGALDIGADAGDLLQPPFETF
jgi:PPE-repeat protein